jgi:hypothetical protein
MSLWNRLFPRGWLLFLVPKQWRPSNVNMLYLSGRVHHRRVCLGDLNAIQWRRLWSGSWADSVVLPCCIAEMREMASQRGAFNRARQGGRSGAFLWRFLRWRNMWRLIRMWLQSHPNNNRSLKLSLNPLDDSAENPFDHLHQVRTRPTAQHPDHWVPKDDSRTCRLFNLCLKNAEFTFFLTMYHNIYTIKFSTPYTMVPSDPTLSSIFTNTSHPPTKLVYKNNNEFHQSDQTPPKYHMKSHLWKNQQQIN